MRIMECERGTHFDPVYLEAFKMIAEALYNRVVRIVPEYLMEQALELVEKYYTEHSEIVVWNTTRNESTRDK